MDALVRHKKAEHGEGSLEKSSKPISTPIIAASHNPPMTAFSPQPQQHIHTTPNTITTINKHKKIPKTSLDTLSKKRPRMNKKSRGPNGFYSSGEESDEESLNNVETKKSLLSGSAEYNQYRLAKAQLHYILRENEMLQDEFEMAQKKLKRMRTERRVLLDAVMASEKSTRHMEEEEENYEHIP